MQTRKDGRRKFEPFFFLISYFIFLISAHPAALHDVLILQHRFEPDSVFVRPGDTVRWTHADAAAHTVTGTGVEIWDSGHMVFGDVYRRVFGADGVLDYVCLYHPMSGKVIVGGPVGVVPSPGAAGDPPSAPAGGRDALGRRTDAGESRSGAITPGLPPR